MILWLRSALFNLCFWTWSTLIVLLLGLIGWLFDEHGIQRYARIWEGGINLLLRVLVGLRYEVRGRENLPGEPVIIASKHQSAWETLSFHLIVPNIVVGLKEELVRIPVFGHYLVKGGNIRIDRSGAARSLKSLVEGAKRGMSQGMSLLIFPEGTRKAPDDPPDYKPGVAAIYMQLKRPCVPVALNSGVFWGRRSFIKRPGTIVVEFLEPIPPGLSRAEFMQLLEERTETATRRLVAEARTPDA